MLKILISNDDGVKAPGIIELHSELKDIAEVIVVAPKQNQSGAGSSITTNKAINVKQLKNGFFSVNGRPADCVYIGIHALCPWEPDLVVSGINLGANMAEDILYSGTVGAALEGRHLKFPPIAVSSAAFKQPGSEKLDVPNYRVAAKVTREIVLKINKLKLKRGTCLNINVPNITYSEDITKTVTKLGTWGYRSPPDSLALKNGSKNYYTTHRTNYPENEYNSDIATLLRNEVSISPFSDKLLQIDESQKISNWLNENF